MLYYDYSVGTFPNRNIWYMPLKGEGKPQPLLRTAFQEGLPQISPDGDYLAYQSDESGQLEIYVCRFPTMTGKQRLSTNGGINPKWDRQGKELFFIKDNSMMSAEVRTRPEFILGQPQKLFDGDLEDFVLTHANPFVPRYDVSLDSRRFVVIQEVEESVQTTTITIVQNWAVRSN